VFASGKAPPRDSGALRVNAKLEEIEGKNPQETAQSASLALSDAKLTLYKKLSPLFESQSPSSTNIQQTTFCLASASRFSIKHPPQ